MPGTSSRGTLSGRDASSRTAFKAGASAGSAVMLHELPQGRNPRNPGGFGSLAKRSRWNSPVLVAAAQGRENELRDENRVPHPNTVAQHWQTGRGPHWYHRTVRKRCKLAPSSCGVIADFPGWDGARTTTGERGSTRKGAWSIMGHLSALPAGAAPVYRRINRTVTAARVNGDAATSMTGLTIRPNGMADSSNEWRSRPVSRALGAGMQKPAPRLALPRLGGNSLALPHAGEFRLDDRAVVVRREKKTMPAVKRRSTGTTRPLAETVGMCSAQASTPIRKSSRR